MFHKELRVYNNIKFYRRMNNISQKELGILVGRTDRTVSAIERGWYAPSLELAMRFGKVFGLSVTELFFERGNEPELRIVKVQRG